MRPRQYDQYHLDRDGSANGTPSPSHKTRLSDDIPAYMNSYIPTFNEEDQRRANARTTSTPFRLPEPISLAAISRFVHTSILTLRASTLTLRPRHFLSLRVLFVLIWVVVIHWGERRTLNSHLGPCDWSQWEEWPSHATPYHAVLIADPQLVDPHTYPGRPWPASALTRAYTDQYMRRAFSSIQERLGGDAVVFLGDLFDGGREWATSREGTLSEGGDKTWRSYRQKYWLKEYRRFSSIFMQPWLEFGQRHEIQDRRFLAGLPGNHDLGLGNGIKEDVRKRFHAYFGEGNRVDMLGNHTFVSVDTVSLSAKGQPDPKTGMPMDEAQGRWIWEPTDQFLHRARNLKARAVKRLLQRQQGQPDIEKILDHEVYRVEDPRAQTIPIDSAQSGKPIGDDDDLGSGVPSILLSHVPLYRPPGTPCGPLRERFPPSTPIDSENPDEPLPSDMRNAIHVEFGEQYQNVLTTSITNEIVDLVGDITHAFTADDHDYCSILHREFSARGGGIREITVKAFSWAMGVRYPGFLLVSLWNPLDDKGHSDPALAAPGGQTLQTHLCLLPDQLGVFLKYVLMLVITLAILLINSIRRVLQGTRTDGYDGEMELPLHRYHDHDYDEPNQGGEVYHSSSTSTDSTGNLAPRTLSNTRTTALSTPHGYNFTTTTPRHGKPLASKNHAGILTRTWRVFSRDVYMIGAMVIIFYLWLIWRF